MIHLISKGKLVENGLNLVERKMSRKWKLILVKNGCIDFDAKLSNSNS